jgi:predicted trehalose synthase
MGSKNPPSEVLAAWIAAQRWFASKTRRITGLDYEDVVPIANGCEAIVAVHLDDGSIDRYAVPFVGGDGAGVVDGLDDAGFCRAVLSLIQRAEAARGARGEIRGVPSPALPATLPGDLAVHRVGGEQSNTSVVFGSAVILKHFRHLVAGLNPEQEITKFLTERTSFRNVPRLFGHLEYRGSDGAVTTLAVSQELVAQAQDGWEWMRAQLHAVHEYESAVAPTPNEAQVREAAATTLIALRQLGLRTAELHRALASDSRDPDFAPEPIGRDDLTAWAAAIGHQLAVALAVLSRPQQPDSRHVARGLAGLLGRQKIRHHGDYHLGQTLYRPDVADFVIIDFEGEPIRPLEERRRKHTVLRDVAGMLRSIDYAAAAGVPAGLDAWASAWRVAATAEFVTAYRTAAARTGLVPESNAGFHAAVAAFELEKAAYEVVYEANHRPDWIDIPARGLERALAAITGPAAAGAA